MRSDRSRLIPGLRSAITDGNGAGVQALLLAGVDPNAVLLPEIRWTAMHLAVALLAHDIVQCRSSVAERRQILDLLLDHGANIWCRDRLGRNAGVLAAGLATTIVGRLRARIAAGTEAHFHHDFFDADGTPMRSGGIPRYRAVPGRVAV